MNKEKLIYKKTTEKNQEEEDILLVHGRFCFGKFVKRTSRGQKQLSLLCSIAKSCCVYPFMQSGNPTDHHFLCMKPHTNLSILYFFSVSHTSANHIRQTA